MARAVQMVKVNPQKFTASLKGAGLTLKSLSAELGYSPSWIRPEGGNVPLAAVNYLKKVYNVDPSEFTLTDDATQVIDPIKVMASVKVAVRDVLNDTIDNNEAFRTFLVQAAKRGVIEYMANHREAVKALIVEAVKEALDE